MWINRGVLHAAAQRVSGWRASLAHEIAHIAQRHAADQLTKTLLAQWSLGDARRHARQQPAGAGTWRRSAGAMMTNGVFLKFEPR